MKCKKAEKWLLRSLDGLLKQGEKIKLKEHLKSCLACQKKREEYQHILGMLQAKDFPEPKPYFWERLEAKLREREISALRPLWKQWSMKAISISLILTAILGLAILLFPTHPKEELSQSEILLLQNTNPFQETRLLLEEEGAEEKNMRLIFTAMEEKNSPRRHFP